MKKMNLKKVFTLRNSKGFTLIELLVVVAIIGILSSVVVASLNNARRKSADAGVKSGLKSAQNQAEIFWNSNTAVVSSYTNVCTNGIIGGVSGSGAAILSAAKAVGLASYNINQPGSILTATCNDSAGAWAAQVPLKVTSGNMWCVDSTGISKEIVGSSLSTANDYTCD